MSNLNNHNINNSLIKNSIVKNSVIILFIISMLSSCQANKQTAGTAIGGVAGALLGSQFGGGSGKVAAAAIGAIAGSLIGGGIGAELDAKDKALMHSNSQAALETAADSQTLPWRNPNSGNYGNITPTRTYKRYHRYCREYNQKVYIGGKPRESFGTACRKPDGSWEIVK